MQGVGCNGKRVKRFLFFRNKKNGFIRPYGRKLILLLYQNTLLWSDVTRKFENKKK